MMLSMLLWKPRKKAKHVFGILLILFTMVSVKSMCAADSGESAYEYDLSGRRTKWTLPNGVTASYKYNANDRLVELTVQKGDEILDKYTYSHDPTGKCTGITYADGSKSF